MILVEPNLPSMPVNVTGPMSMTPQSRARRLFRNVSGYDRARNALKVAFGLECGLAAGAVAYCAVTRSSVIALLMALACAALLLVSFAAMEMAGAIFDIADSQGRGPGHAPESGEPRW